MKPAPMQFKSIKMPKTDMPSFDLTTKLSFEMANKVMMQQERRMRLVIRPKPWWMSERRHKRLLNTLLVMECFQ